MLAQIQDLIKKRRNFGFETTLAGKSYVNLFRKFQNHGYKINLYFLWVRNVKLSIKRISDRVRSGGHHVPEIDVRRRYISGIKNLFSLYQPFCDSIIIIDNSTINPVLMALGNHEGFIEMEPALFEKFKNIAGIRGEQT